jgi:hypothetical protein
VITLAAATPFTLPGADIPKNPNRLSLGLRFGLNYKADFQNKARFFNSVNPGPATGGVNHRYDDGYVLVDGSSGGNLGGLTTYWGYQNASQVVGSSMEFHALQASGSSSTTDDPQYGLELNYQRVLGTLPAVSSSLWGLEVGFGYTDLDFCSRERGRAPVITDAFPLGLVLPPSAGYNGTFTGPGALLGDTPVRTLGSAAVTANQELSGQLFSFRLGPFAEWQLAPKFSLTASAGLTLAPTSLDYDFSDTGTLASGVSIAARGHTSKTELLYGPYVGATLRYDYSDHWGVYVGAQYQSLNDLDLSIGSRTARFDPGSTVNLTTGIMWRF